MIQPAIETALEFDEAGGMLYDQMAPGASSTGMLSLADVSLTTNSSTTGISDATLATNDVHSNHHRHSGPHSVQSLPCLNDLIAVLIECFALIAIGYFSGRFKLVSSDSKDIGAYLTTFALPMIIFLNIAQMEIHTINLSFLACMLASKLLLFMLVSLITLAISFPSNFSYAGALSILATQSNDFALGYPLFKSLYGESKPEMLSYLNLMGPIQLLIINPLGIVMLEFEKARTNRAHRRQGDPGRSRCSHCLDGLRQPVNSRQTARMVSSAAESRVVARGRAQLGLAWIPRSPLGQSSDRKIRSSEMRSKNIKSLALIIPARVLTERNGARNEESGDNSIECYPPTDDCTTRGTKTLPDLSSPLELTHSSDSIDREAARQGPKLPSTCAKSEAPTRPAIFPREIVNHERHMRPVFAVQSQLGNSSCSRCVCGGTGVSGPLEREPIIDLGFVRALLSNPLIIASVVALAVNLINGPELPKFVTKVSNTIAASFAAPALFVVGLSMYGKFKLILRNPNDLLLSSVLVLTKVFILPNLMRTIMLIVLPHYTDAEEIPYLADFAYLYGLLPTAPGACIIAKQYEVLTNVVSICMLLSTFISAPMMLGTSAIISQVSATAPETTLNILAQTIRISSSITLTLSLLTLFMLWKSNRRIMRSLDRIVSSVAELRSTHMFTFLLTLTQLVIGIGGFMWLFVNTSSLRQQDLVDSMARDGSAVQVSGVAVSGLDLQWAREDLDVIMADDERTHTLESMELDSRASALAPNSQALCFSALCTTIYLLTSGGLLMARFVILCIVVTKFAKHFRGHQFAVQVSSLMLRTYPLFGVGIILCLVFESHHLNCTPSESSLPAWTFSLYLRLTFNAILLMLAVPLFTANFRLTNKAAWLEAQSMQEAAGPPGELLEKRRFVTSNASLSSDTSSAMTTSTSLDTTLNGSANHQSQRSQTSFKATVPVIRDQQALASSNPDRGSAVLLVDVDAVSRRPAEASAKFVEDHVPICKQSWQPNSNDVSPHRNRHLVGAAIEVARREERQKDSSLTQCDINNNSNLLSKQAESENETTRVIVSNDALDEHSTHNIPQDREPTTITTHSILTTATQAITTDTRQANANDRWPPVAEFNEYSILIVFMLFQALVSLTSIIQLLNQDKPSGGTFVMGEITNVTIDFGQGLVTFFVIGSQSYFKDLISSSHHPTEAPTDQRNESQA